MRIRTARVTELSALQAIERAAGLMFCDIGMPEIAQYDPWPLPVMAVRQDADRLWAVANDDDEPVAYLMADLVDGCLQIEQVTVHPGNARRGLGRALLDHAANQAAADGLPALTLTTFAHVPWNAPYYARCGFRILDDAEITPGVAGDQGTGSRSGRGPVAASMHAPRPLRPPPGVTERGKQCQSWH